MLPGHAERPDRLRAIGSYLEATGILDGFDCREAPELDPSILPAIHDAEYLNALNALSPAEGLVAVDPDTALCPHSLGAARRAAGAVTDAVRNVLSGQTNRAFCAVRPPGHHAERDAAMGFCLYNSIALGAEQALQDPAVKRVAILDFDVHHGNGTVDIFKDRPEVMVCSSFQHPYYPHRYYDIQRPNIVNTPLPAGTGSRDFRIALEADWLPAFASHRPDLILISAGFDAHRNDPLAGLELHEADFTWVTELIVAAAESFSRGRIVSALEGGYDLDALARSVQAHLEVLST
jgi:acetoin utilization deacetylase AcuC-like enzyme